MCGIDITSVPILWDNREKEYIRKQYKAVFSDADGRYVVTIGKNDTIHIQMSGYQSRKVCIGNREIKDCKTTINVQLNH